MQLTLLIYYIDHYNITDGASNGNELLIFFEDALTIQSPFELVICDMDSYSGD